MFDRAILRRAILDALRKLDPRTLARNPVMFVVEVGARADHGPVRPRPRRVVGAPERVRGLVAVFLWFTVLFANFAEAMAEGRGKAQAATLRATRADTIANGCSPTAGPCDGRRHELQVGDLCVVTAGEVIPGDGDVVEGIATVDESAITGESAPVIRE